MNKIRNKKRHIVSSFERSEPIKQFFYQHSCESKELDKVQEIISCTTQFFKCAQV